ncbi:HEPN-associated N-terminal domain-containing protein [Ereboglobus luteus]|uniref:RES domain-containing protein n=1 Tax=Ereboglobus luteus TaxID=1796921 RepID=A0A2U8E638_9BACT|nr:HEPN-associated N-terminal domain-containing protein [Ereboglobus luteus]AWI10333.1 hypothetical protein CKA38_14665 [Ereboglobus luteus]
MGGTKRYFEKLQAERRGGVSDKYVCAGCFDDYAIEDYITTNASVCECSYCGRVSDEKIAADANEVFSFIAKGINREYEDPANEVPYDSSEGGYLVAPTDGWDLICDLGIVKDGRGFNDLFNDLCKEFGDNAYVHHDPLGSTESESLRFSWRQFCNMVKHEKRFVFYRSNDDEHKGDDSNYYADDEPPVHAILDGLAHLVTSHDLITKKESGHTFVRARQHPGKVTFTEACQLGAPPAACAKQSRMSPAGIPMFYAAENEMTAFIETYDASDIENDAMTFGFFAAKRPLVFINLENIPPAPSLFDEGQHHLMHQLRFLNEFSRDISKPVTRTGEAHHYKYVPTQIIAEYFRWIFRTADGSRVDGIQFKSSRPYAGTCYCIFADEYNCVDKDWETKVKRTDVWRIKPMLELKSSRKEDPSKLKTEPTFRLLYSE